MAETGPWDDMTASAPKAGPADDGPWTDFGGSGASEKPTDGSMSLGDMALKAAENAPSSALKFGKDLVQPIMHPIDTAQSLGRVALGTVEKAIPGGEYRHEKYADAVGRYFKDRYGGLENVKRSFAEDPVGVLSDASMALTGGGSAAARLPGMLGRAGEIAGTVGRTIDPVMAPVNAAKAGSELVGGLGTHTGSGPLKEAYKAGLEGGEKGDVFRQEMRGNADMSDVVDTAREGMSGLYEQKARQYNQDMGSVKANNAVLNFDGVDQAMARAEKVKKFGTEDLQKKTGAIRQEIADQIEHWRNLDPAEYHTPAGFDALKQSIGDIMDHTEFGSPARRVAREAYNAVKQEIVKQAPEYAKAMSNYESAMGLIREMEKTLSLKQGANIDTTLRKLQSIMRNNVNANYGRRLELGQMLEESGAKNLMARLAGQTLNTWTPRGLGKAAAEIGLLGAGAHAAAFPWAAAALPAMSPRLMGEASHLAGRTVGRGLNATGAALGRVGMGNRGVGDLSYELGRTANESNRASGGAVGRAIRASKGYAEGGAPELSDDDQAAMMPETFVPEGVRKWTEQAAPKDYNLISGSVKGMATLPQRAIESARNYRETGEYDPGPILEAATLPMGTGAIAGLRMAPREVALGVGPIRKMTPPNLFDAVAEKYPDLKIDGSAARSPNDYATLSRISVPKELRGQGLATKAMQDIVAEADKSGTNLALTPSGDWGASVPRLKDFYSRFGFVPNAGKAKDFATRETMIRPFAEPNSATAGIGPAPGIRAYHGSPHDFDKFDLSKIGTGEGAQAYGHGLYFADNEGVAQSYRDGVTRAALSRNGSPQTAQEMAYHLMEDGKDHALLNVNRRLSMENSSAEQSMLEDARKMIESGDVQSPGKMYEVNINADPSHFLDWDKPLSQQSDTIKQALKLGELPTKPTHEETMAVFKKAKELGVPPNSLPEYKALEARMDSANAGAWERFGVNPSNVHTRPEDMTGAQLYQAWEQGKLGPHQLTDARSPAVADRLREAGIPGIKYLDQGSRGAGEGSSNYVLFNDKLIDIVRKYALAGIALPPAIAEAYDKMQNGRATGGPVMRAIRAAKG